MQATKELLGKPANRCDSIYIDVFKKKIQNEKTTTIDKNLSVYLLNKKIEEYLNWSTKFVD